MEVTKTVVRMATTSAETSKTEGKGIIKIHDLTY
jgi:hypothetical protein